MESLETITNKINDLHGDYSNYKTILNKELVYLADGRKAAHSFVVRSNIRTLRSGPNRGKIRVDGAVIVMIGNRNPKDTETALVRNGRNLSKTLDTLASKLQSRGN